MTTTPDDIYLQQPNPQTRSHHCSPGSHCRHPPDHLYRIYDHHSAISDLGWMLCYLCGATAKVMFYDQTTKEVRVETLTQKNLREGT